MTVKKECPICNEPAKRGRATCGDKKCVAQIMKEKYMDPDYKAYSSKKIREGIAIWKEFGGEVSLSVAKTSRKRRRRAKKDFYRIANLLERPLMRNTDIIRARLEIRSDELMEFLIKTE